jgi:hypothetical protein
MLVIRKGEIRDKMEAGWIEKENGDKKRWRAMNNKEGLRKL